MERGKRYVGAKQLLMMCVLSLMLCFVPGVKVMAADRVVAANETWKPTADVTCTKLTVNGTADFSDTNCKKVEVSNFEVAQGAKVVLDDTYLIVNGNASISGEFILKNGSVLLVKGDYYQPDGSVDYAADSEINVKGNFIFQKRNAAGTMTHSTASLFAKGILRVDKNFTVDSTGNMLNLRGDFYVGGDVELIDTTDIYCLRFLGEFNLTNENPQTISMSNCASIENLKSSCNTVKSANYLNVGKVQSDITFVSDSRKFVINYPNSVLDKTVTFDGNVVVETGKLEVNNGGTLTIKGNLQALEGSVSVQGNLIVEGDLRFEKENAAGVVTTVGGSFYQSYGAKITVKKNFTWNSTGNGLNFKGTMDLYGDYNDRRGAEWGGTVRLLSTGQHVTIAEGGKIYHLYVEHKKGDYFFNPDPCWEELTEGEPTTPSGNGTTTEQGNTSNNQNGNGNTTNGQDNGQTNQNNNSNDQGNTQNNQGNNSNQNNAQNGQNNSTTDQNNNQTNYNNNTSNQGENAANQNSPSEVISNNDTQKAEQAQEKIDSSIKKTKIKSVKAAKKKFTLTLKKTNSINGYEVQYDTSKEFTSAKTKNLGAKKTSLTVKKLKPKTTYFVRIRSYKNTDEGKVYSNWSKVKKVKVK